MVQSGLFRCAKELYVNCCLFLKQVWAQALGSLHGLVELPLANLRLVAAQQNLRYLPTLVVGWAGVDRS